MTLWVLTPESGELAGLPGRCPVWVQGGGGKGGRACQQARNTTQRPWHTVREERFQRRPRVPCGLVGSEAPHGRGGQERLPGPQNPTKATSDRSTEHLVASHLVTPSNPRGTLCPPHFTKGETEVWGGAITCPGKAPRQVDQGWALGGNRSLNPGLGLRSKHRARTASIREVWTPRSGRGLRRQPSPQGGKRGCLAFTGVTHCCVL